MLLVEMTDATARLVVDGERVRVGVVEATQRVEEIDDVTGVLDHPRRVLPGDDHVEARHVEVQERLVGVEHLGQGRFGRRDGQQFDVVTTFAQAALQRVPQTLGATDHVPWCDRGDDADPHRTTLLIERPCSRAAALDGAGDHELDVVGVRPEPQPLGSAPEGVAVDPAPDRELHQIGAARLEVVERWEFVSIKGLHRRQL